MKKKKKSQKSTCKHKVAFFTLNSPPLTRDTPNFSDMEKCDKKLSVEQTLGNIILEEQNFINGKKNRKEVGEHEEGLGV